MWGGSVSGIMYETENRSVGGFPSVNLDSKNLTFVLHYHEELEIICVRKGTISAYFGSREIKLNKDDICIFMPGEVHGFQSVSDNSIDIIKINPNPFAEIIEFDKMSLEQNTISPDDCNYNFLICDFDEICTEYEKKEAGYEFAVRSHINNIIKTIIRNMNYSCTDKSKSFELVDRINQYLKQNYSEEITLENVAGACHFSKYYFAHKIKELTGMTFVQYLSVYRAERAAELLRTSGLSVTDVADKCGFNNLRSFNRTFKAVYNITPLAYRRISKKY